MAKRVKLTIKRLGNDGEGIAYYQNKPVFIDYALIDEVVEVDLETNSRGNFEGKNLTVLKESPLRVKPPCPYYFKCGGCQMQHLPYFETIKHKRNVINFLYNVNLRKETKKTKLNLTILSPEEYRYRNRVILPVREIDNKLSVGLFYKDSNVFMPINTCLIHKLNIDLLIDNILKILESRGIKAFDPKTKKGTIRFLVVRTNQSGDLQVTFILYHDLKLDNLAEELITNNPKVVSVFKDINNNLRSRDFFTNKLEKLLDEDYLEETIGNKKYLLAPDTFFQLNTKQARNMYDELIRMANFNKNEVVLEGYAGVSTIGIYISDLVKHVHSIEINPGAVVAGNKTLEHNNIENITIHEGDTLEVAKTLDIKFDVAIFDPPRTGLGKDLVNYLLKTEPKKILYCSCNPKTLTDDLKTLSKKYHIVETTPIDMFPQTYHIESVTLLKLK